MAQRSEQNKTNIMSLFDVKSHFCDVVRRVENGESITILKHNVPVACIGPMTEVKKPKYTKREAIEKGIIDAKGKMLKDDF